MAIVTLQGNQIETVGALPGLGEKAPDFQLTATDLSMKGLKDFTGKVKVLNVFPSLDTGVCAASVRRFNKEAGGLENTVVLCISADLPFAHSRFCEIEGLKDVISLSTFRSSKFGKNYGVNLITGPLTGLLSRAVIVLDSSDLVIYTELVPEITQEPDYEAVLNVLKELM